MKHESIQEFYQRFSETKGTSFTPQFSSIGHFNVFQRSACSFLTPYSRRDYYKISLVLGTGELHYANRWIKVDRPALLFSNPIIPYSWEIHSPEQAGRSDGAVYQRGIRLFHPRRRVFHRIEPDAPEEEP